MPRRITLYYVECDTMSDYTDGVLTPHLIIADANYATVVARRDAIAKQAALNPDDRDLCHEAHPIKHASVTLP